MLDEHISQDTSQMIRDTDEMVSLWGIPSTRHTKEGGTQVKCALLRNDGQGVLRLGEDLHSPVVMAASCLVKAVAGDRVRAVFDEDSWYVIDILRRSDAGAPLDIDVGGKALNVRAERLSLSTQDLQMSTQTWSTSATYVRQHHGSEVTHVEQRYVRAGSSATDVDTTAVTRAAHIVSHASQALVLRGKAASLGADGLLRIDGTQVHMG